jgi:hypothetical protein
VLALDEIARLLDQPVVLDAARAGGHACHAPEAAVEVLDDRRRELHRSVRERAHEIDPPAG